MYRIQSIQPYDKAKHDSNRTTALFLAGEAVTSGLMLEAVVWDSRGSVIAHITAKGVVPNFIDFDDREYDRDVILFDRNKWRV